MSQRGTSWVLAALLGGALAVTACGGGGQTTQEAPELIPGPRIVKPVTTDGEIYYFPTTGDDYRASLSAFRKANPDLRCRYFGADDKRELAGHSANTAIAAITGHTIVCTDTATNAQGETVP